MGGDRSGPSSLCPGREQGLPRNQGSRPPHAPAPRASASEQTNLSLRLSPVCAPRFQVGDGGPNIAARLSLAWARRRHWSGECPDLLLIYGGGEQSQEAVGGTRRGGRGHEAPASSRRMLGNRRETVPGKGGGGPDGAAEQRPIVMSHRGGRDGRELALSIFEKDLH